MQETGEKPEVMTAKDAMMFPVIASCTLFAIYVFFKFVSREYLNQALTAYFFVLGVLALAQVLQPVVEKFLKSMKYYDLKLTSADSLEDEKPEYLMDFQFTTGYIYALIFSLVIGVWYLLKKVFLI